MAESEAKLPAEKKVEYQFLLAAAFYVEVCLLTLYDYAKYKSGPLKSVVQTVEDTVKPVIRPVYYKFHRVTTEILSFLDRMVSVLINEVDRHLPSFIKQALSEALALASEVQRAGLVDTVRNISKTVYAKYEPLAELYAELALLSLVSLPLVPQVAHILFRTAAYWFEKYNQAVAYLAEKGYKVASDMPLIPVERIAKVFAGAENGPTNVNVEVEETYSD